MHQIIAGPRRLRIGTLALVALILLSGPALASGVTVDIDRATLNDLLAGLAARRVEVPLSAKRAMTVELQDLEIVELVPSTGDRSNPGSIRTRLSVRIPDFGLVLPVEPLLGLEVERREGASRIVLRFREVRLALPLGGGVDIAPFLGPLQFPAENLWQLDGGQGAVGVRSSLESVTLTEAGLRLGFAIGVTR